MDGILFVAAVYENWNYHFRLDINGRTYGTRQKRFQSTRIQRFIDTEHITTATKFPKVLASAVTRAQTKSPIATNRTPSKTRSPSRSDNRPIEMPAITVIAGAMFPRYTCKSCREGTVGRCWYRVAGERRNGGTEREKGRKKGVMKRELHENLRAGSGGVEQR